MQVKANQDLRQEMKAAGLTFWRVADGLGCSEPTLIRWLRHELPEDVKAKIRAVITTLTGQEV